MIFSILQFNHIQSTTAVCSIITIVSIISSFQTKLIQFIHVTEDECTQNFNSFEYFSIIKMYNLPIKQYKFIHMCLYKISYKLIIKCTPT